MKMTGDLSKVYPGQVDGKKHTADLMHVWQVEQAAVMLTKPGFFEWPIRKIIVNDVEKQNHLVSAFQIEFAIYVHIPHF